MDSFYHFINSLEEEQNLLIFLGAGASIEGSQNGGPFPDFTKIIEIVLTAYNQNHIEDEKKRWNSFLSIMERWSNEGVMEERFSKLVAGEPGAAHYHLAALILSAYSNRKNFNLVLTTNYDNLIDDALNEIRVGAWSDSISTLYKGNDATNFLEKLFNKASSGSPVILKLFGNTATVPPIFHQEKMVLDSAAINTLRDWLKYPMLFIGYSFSDNFILDLVAGSDGRKPIFAVSPQEHLNDSIIRHERVHHIQDKFFPFIHQTVRSLKERNSKIVSDFDELLSKVDPKKLYSNCEHIRVKSKIVSEYMLAKIKGQFTTRFGEITIIDRDESRPPWKEFLESNTPCFALIGHSGSGKTTLLYDLVKHSFTSDYYCVFYSIQQLDVFSSFRKKLASDFNTDERLLAQLMQHLGSILEHENKSLLLVIDAVNETQLSMTNYKTEFEELALNLPGNIKLIYSCKTSTWNNQHYSTAQLPDGVYFKNQVFHLERKYSESENALAFFSYQSTFKFQGQYEALHDDMKLHMSDPFLLKVIAFVYHHVQLPNRVQVNQLFEKYHQEITKRLNSFSVSLILEKIIEIQLDGFFKNGGFKGNFIDALEVYRIDEIINLITIHQNSTDKASEPFNLLADEGIIVRDSERSNVYSFFHDRYHEFLLSQSINKHINESTQKAYIKCLTDGLKKVRSDQIAIYNAMVIYCARNGFKNNSVSFMNQDFLSLLFSSKERLLYYFTIDVIRAVLNEHEFTLEQLKNTFSQFDDSVLFDILQDNPKMEILLVQGLLSSNCEIMRRCVQLINGHTQKDDVILKISNKLLFRIRDSKEFQDKECMALIFLSSCYISRASKIEGFKPVVNFWQEAINKGINSKSKARLVNSLKFVIEQELVHFIPSLFGDNSFNYLWRELTKGLKEDICYLMDFFIDKPIGNDEKLRRVIMLFGSEFRDYSDIKSHENLFTYKLEYKLAKWLLIKRSKTNYEEVKQFLDSLVNSGFWLTIDFSLCVMKYILQQVYFNNERVLKDGYETLKKWTTNFESSSSAFYFSLSSDNPFQCHFNSLSQVSRIEAEFFKSPDGSIDFLKRRVQSSELNSVRLATLSLRQLWRDHCDSVLATLVFVFSHEDKEVREWVDKTLSEIYLIHPVKIDLFLKNVNCPLQRRNKIKYESEIKETSGVEYFGEPLYTKIFLGSEQNLKVFLELYKSLLFDCNSTFEFCEYIVECFINYLKTRSLPI